jgi:hypothetical protein
MTVQEEAEVAAAMEARVSRDPWSQLLYTGRMEPEREAPPRSGIFEAPPLDGGRIRAA